MKGTRPGRLKFESNVLFSQIADVVIADTDTATEMLSQVVPLPVGFWKPGKCIEIALEGYLSTAAMSSPTINVTIEIGEVVIGTTIDSSQVFIPEDQVNSYFCFRIKLTCRTVGSPGTFQSAGVAEYSDSVSGNIGTVKKFGLVRYDGEDIDNSEIEIDTTIESNVSCLFTWGTASSDNKITITTASVKVL